MLETALRLRLLLLLCLTATSSSPAQPLLSAEGWRAGATVSLREVERYGLERCFSYAPIPDKVFRRMQGKSFPAGARVRRSSLSYLRVLHYDGQGRIRLGEMVCAKAIAQDLKEIFRELFQSHYPIERMVLIDDYDASDERSMRANNTSSFCYRAVKGSRRLSKHALGRAVDINPLYNPCVKWRRGRRHVQPTTGAAYANRSRKFPYKIDRQDLCYRLFRQHGFRWGGAWKHTKDYQHFEK